MQAAGKRKHRITIQSAGTVASGLDTGQQHWASPITVCQCLASIEPLEGRERWQAMQVEAEVTHRITILYRPGITSAMRAILDGRIFHFGSVIDKDERHEELEILATEIIG